MHHLDLSLHTPRQKMPAGELRTVVAANRTRVAPLDHDRLQHARHSTTGEARINFQSQTLPRIGIDHAQHSDRPPALHRIVHKIQRPFLVRRSPRLERCSYPNAVLALLPPKAQTGLSIHPMYPFMIHGFSRPEQQHVQPPIREPWLLPR